MSIVNEISRINYEAFISIITESNRVDDNWSIKVKDSGICQLGNNRTIRDILLTSDEVTITHIFQNNDRIMVCKSFDKYILSYQGLGKHLKEYEALIDKIVDGSKPISSNKVHNSSMYRFLNSTM